MYTNHPTATIEALLLPTDPQDFWTTPRSEIEFDLETNAVVGDVRHAGFIRAADVRTPSYTRGRDITLNRQSVSIVGAENLDEISNKIGLNHNSILDDMAYNLQLDRETSISLMAADLGVEVETLEAQPSRITRLFLAQCLGANILLGNFGASLQAKSFEDIERGMDVGPYDPGKRKFTDAAVMITRPNEPCHSIGREILQRYPGVIPDIDKQLLRASRERRGFVGMVVKSGKMTVGQTVQFVPLGER